MTTFVLYFHLSADWNVRWVCNFRHLLLYHPCIERKITKSFTGLPNRVRTSKIQTGGHTTSEKNIYLFGCVGSVWRYAASLVRFGTVSVLRLFWLLCSVWDLSSPKRDRTSVHYIARQILNHWATRTVPVVLFCFKVYYDWHDQADVGVVQRKSVFGHLFMYLASL